MYRFTLESDDGGAPLTLQSEVFEQLKPGLSNFAEAPKEGAASLKPLLETGLNAVPDAMELRTPVELKATAGLRLLGESQAEAILDATRALLAQYPFSLDPERVEIMDGLDEGLYAWVTVNYLLGRVTGPSRDTAAVLDLGGGSTQIATAAGADAMGLGIRSTDVLGTQHNMFLHSYLGLGLMAGRSAVLALAANGPTPCAVKGAQISFKYGDASYKGSRDENSGPRECIERVQSLLRSADGPFAKAPAHPRFSNGQPIFAMSYYFDRAIYVGLVEPDAVRGRVTVQQFRQAAHTACALRISELSARYPHVAAEDAEFLCLDLSFITALLGDGFGIGSHDKIDLAKKLPYNGEEIETAWPLGASLASLSKQEL